MTERLKILGGPGCGKSFTLMQKYTDLLNSGYTNEDITLITFRKSSAEDLVNSVMCKTNLSEKFIKKHVGTIHSICWRLGGYKETVNSKDIKQFLTDYKYTPYTKAPTSHIDDDESVYSGDVFDLYTWLRNTCTPVNKVLRYPGISNVKLPIEYVPKFLEDYTNFKQKIGKIDYSDMLQDVLESNIDLDTPVLMIDEFQDLTAQMYKLFEMWVPKRETVLIAGDPFQSIYGFWGGSPTYFNEWEAAEYVIGETRRLPQPVQDFARQVLRVEGMYAPDIKAKQNCVQPIKTIKYSDSFPTHTTELHLIRCNYLSSAVAQSLARSGKVFGGIASVRWTDEEILLANSILAYRSGKVLTKEAMAAIINAYPIKLYGDLKKEELSKLLEKNYTADPRKNASFLKPVILDSMLSDDPTARMQKTDKLFTAKIKGILERKTPIMPWERNNRKILTIHGSKGLEADAVFLHTAITGKINHAIVVPCEESAAEARVWYVGITRAKEVLYIVKDEGKNYRLPEMATC